MQQDVLGHFELEQVREKAARSAAFVFPILDDAGVLVGILAKSNLFMLGGGKAMMNAYYDTASRSGVQIAYESEVSELKIHDGEFLSAVVSGNGAAREVEAKAIVVASGDTGEPPLKGGLLVARHGNGYVVYTSLAWFRQLPDAVPGAYRLFANLVSAATPVRTTASASARK